ncbi:type II toxin-antitoxin system RelE/ParE family toxin [Superficieibacter sp. BNK-5]|uniref:type II toxin-antitoxin system RelE/ParE family toxin n=1 Tax=Superficieibacter sp. BNK-5 TaxID=3376142 RepID=UPI0039BFEC7A
MIFVETDVFTEYVTKLLDDDEYRKLQIFLTIQPDHGDVIPDTGGLRKIRWMVHGRGKRGGVRVIYFYRASSSEIRLLLIYRKGIKDNLTQQEKTILRMLNERW